MLFVFVRYERLVELMNNKRYAVLNFRPPCALYVGHPSSRRVHQRVDRLVPCHALQRHDIGFRAGQSGLSILLWRRTLGLAAAFLR
jgi:hypothetical protein